MGQGREVLRSDCRVRIDCVPFHQDAINHLRVVYSFSSGSPSLSLTRGCPLKGASMLALIAKEIKQEFPYFLILN